MNDYTEFSHEFMMQQVNVLKQVRDLIRYDPSYEDAAKEVINTAFGIAIGCILRVNQENQEHINIKN